MKVIQDLWAIPQRRLLAFAVLLGLCSWPLHTLSRPQRGDAPILAPEAIQAGQVPGPQTAPMDAGWLPIHMRRLTYLLWIGATLCLFRAIHLSNKEFVQKDRSKRFRERPGE